MGIRLHKEKIFLYYKYSTLRQDSKITISSPSVQFFETVNSKIWLINPNLIAIDLSLLEKLDNIKSYVHDINGIWACIIQDKTNNNFRTITSINNEQPWYYLNFPTPVVANNIFLLKTYITEIKPDYKAISSFLTFDFCYGGETFLSNVKKSYGGDIIYINGDKLEIVSADLTKWLGFDESISDRKVILDAFISSVDKILVDQPAQIVLTGGSDSRSILAAALHTKKKFTFMTGTSPSTDIKDIKIARKISKHLGIKHYEVDESKLIVNDLENVIEEIAIKTNAEFIPRNWIMFYKEYAMHSTELNGLSRLIGYRGEIFKGFPLNALKSFDNKSLIIKDTLKNVLRDLLNYRFEKYKELFSINVHELFYQREHYHFWVSSNIKSYQNYCHIYTPFSDNFLLSLGYRFSGGIKKSKLHESSFKLLPEYISNLSFQSSLINRAIRHYKNKVFTKVNYDYMLKPDYLFQDFKMEILYEVM